MNKNTELFIKTIDRLDNELPKFYNSLDVILYLEQ